MGELSHGWGQRDYVLSPPSLHIPPNATCPWPTPFDCLPSRSLAPLIPISRTGRWTCSEWEQNNHGRWGRKEKRWEREMIRSERKNWGKVREKTRERVGEEREREKTTAGELEGEARAGWSGVVCWEESVSPLMHLASDKCCRVFFRRSWIVWVQCKERVWENLVVSFFHIAPQNASHLKRIKYFDHLLRNEGERSANLSQNSWKVVLVGACVRSVVHA